MTRALLSLILLVAAGDVLACSCITRDPKTTFKNAAAVFLGEVVEYDGTVARLRVLEAFKNVGRDEVVEVRTGEDGASCGYGAALTPGSRHLLYAYDAGGHLGVSICNRSRPEKEAAACDLPLLRSRAGWWRSPLSSFRLFEWLSIRWNPCPRYT